MRPMRPMKERRGRKRMCKYINECDSPGRNGKGGMLKCKSCNDKCELLPGRTQ